MAFKLRDLSVLAYANGFTLWHYTSTDTADEVCRDGYFNGVKSYEPDSLLMLRAGDMILANLDTDGTSAAGIFLVSFSDNVTVKVNDLTAVGKEQVSADA